MSDCLTCTNSTLGSDLVFAISENREIQNALSKHFWFDEEQCLQSVICYKCWHQIEDFHRFYCEVRKLNLELHIRPLSFQTQIKVKNEIYPVDLASEVAADNRMVVENGEIYSSKYDNPQVDVVPESPEQPSEYTDDDVGDVGENDTDASPPTKIRSKKRPRMQNNEKDEVQECDHCFQQCISRDALKKHLRMDHNVDIENPISDAKEIELSVMRTEIVKEGPSGIQESEHESDASENVSSSEEEDDDDDNSRQNESKVSQPFKLTEEDIAQAHIFVEKNRKLDCDMCSERFMRFQDLQKHSIEKHNNTRTGLCCNRKFRDTYRFVAHMLYHVNPERFKCTECHRICPSSEALRGHIKRMHTSGGKYSCHLCDRKFPTKWSAKRHVEKHEDPIRFDADKIIAENYTLRCDTCHKKHNSYLALQNHSMTEHGRRSTVRCCKQKMRYRSELVDHCQYHHNPQMFTCKICLKPWQHSRALWYHMRYKHRAEWETINNAKGS